MTIETGKNLVQKILECHLAEGECEPGEEIALKIDQTLTHDATGTLAFLQLEAMNVQRIRTELSVNYVDHNTLQIGSENADDHRYLETMASKNGIVFSRAGNGICHQVHLERFSKPGRTLLGSDSHTPTCGGVGMIAIGAGGLDVAIAMASGSFHVTCPHVIKINLTGGLKPWISAKDVALKILEMFTTKGNVDCAFEYCGEGTATLSVPERATITNMSAECGVTTSIFPSDSVTREFLRAQRRERDWIGIQADENAEYERVVDLDLGSVVPLIACPHSPGNIKEVRELDGVEVNQVCIGSCTNSSFKDLMTVARILKGKKVHSNVSLVVEPGSRQVLENVARENGLIDIISSGARLAESACGFCIGNGQSPQTGAVSIRTSNRNFLGRSGTKNAQVYLTSPETAAAAAILGEITDPRNLENIGIICPQIRVPERFFINDSMLVYPSEHPEKVKIFRGPNIGELPISKPMPEAIDGEVTIKVGDRVTTDDIIPAGDKMRYRSNIPKYSQFVFEPIDPAFYRRALRIRDEGRHNIIIGGLSYGQGSSREHAAICPMYLGVRVVIARSLERIHTRNLINFGIIPLTFKRVSDYDKTEIGDKLEILNIREAVKQSRELAVKNKTKNTEFEVGYSFSDREKEILLVGGTLEYFRNRSA